MKPKSGRNVGRPRKRKTESTDAGSESKRTALQVQAQTELNVPAEPEPVAIQNKSIDGRNIDSDCWLCHTLCNVPEEDNDSCFTCPRVYHRGCLNEARKSFSTEGACPECQLDSVNGLQFPKSVTVERLRELLAAVTLRVDAKKRNYKDLFLAWPLEAKVFRVMDMGILMSKINDSVPYTKTAEFFSDVKWIYHNCCVLYGEESEQAKAANLLKKDFTKELLDLEACPECYFHLYCDGSEEDFFIRMCDPPHDIVWAQFSKHPFWPAKCLRVINSTAHVRFFGEHEVSNVPVRKCYFISDSHPKYKNSRLRDENSALKMPLYKASIKELLQYIHLYESEKGRFRLHPFQTPYKVATPKPPSAIPSQAPEPVPPAVLAKQNRPENIPYVDLSDDPEDIDVVDMDFTEQETTSSGQLHADSTSQNNSINSDNSPEERYLPLSYEDTPATQEASVSQSSPSEATPTLQTPLPPKRVTTLPQEKSSVRQLEEGRASPGEVDPGNGMEEEDENDEVEVIEVLEDGVSSDALQRQRINPSLVLPYILDQNRNLQRLFQDGKSVLDAMFVQLWANASQTPFAPELIVNAISDKKSLEAEVQRLQKEKEELLQSKAAIEEEAHRKYQQDIKILNHALEAERRKRESVTKTARGIVSSLQKRYIDEMNFQTTKNQEKLEEKEKLMMEKDTALLKSENEIHELRINLNNAMNERLKLEEEYKKILEELSKGKQNDVLDIPSIPLQSDYFSKDDFIGLDLDDATSDQII